jgi:hypothetical protein
VQNAPVGADNNYCNAQGIQRTVSERLGTARRAKLSARAKHALGMKVDRM